MKLTLEEARAQAADAPQREVDLQKELAAEQTAANQAEEEPERSRRALIQERRSSTSRRRGRASRSRRPRGWQDWNPKGNQKGSQKGKGSGQKRGKGRETYDVQRRPPRDVVAGGDAESKHDA